MAGVKISQLPAIVAPAITDIFPVVQSGTTYKETITQLASLVSSNIAANSITNAMLAQMGAYTIKGNNTNATANPQDISAGQYPATHTNDAASAGNLGEFISSQILNASAVALTDGNPANVTSIALTAGDWDVNGNVQFNIGGNSTNTIGWISATSATLPDYSLITAIELTSTFGVNVGFPVPYKRISIAAPTTIYLSAICNFSTSTATVSGGIFARRAR